MGKKKRRRRGEEADHEHVEVGRGMWREGAEREGGKSREQESKEGANSPFYTEAGIPGCCQVTVGWSLEEMLTRIISKKIFLSKTTML